MTDPIPSDLLCNNVGLPAPANFNNRSSSSVTSSSSRRISCGSRNPGKMCDYGLCCSATGFCGPIPVASGIYIEAGVPISQEDAENLYCENTQGDWRGWTPFGKCIDLGISYPWDPFRPPPRFAPNHPSTPTSTATIPSSPTSKSEFIPISSSEHQQNGSSTPISIIISIVLAILFVLFIMIAVWWWWCKYRHKSKLKHNPQLHHQPTNDTNWDSRQPLSTSTTKSSTHLASMHPNKSVQPVIPSSSLSHDRFITPNRNTTTLHNHDRDTYFGTGVLSSPTHHDPLMTSLPSNNRPLTPSTLLAVQAPLLPPALSSSCSSFGSIIQGTTPSPCSTITPLQVLSTSMNSTHYHNSNKTYDLNNVNDPVITTSPFTSNKYSLSNSSQYNVPGTVETDLGTISTNYVSGLQQQQHEPNLHYDQNHTNKKSAIETQFTSTPNQPIYESNPTNMTESIASPHRRSIRSCLSRCESLHRISNAPPLSYDMISSVVSGSFISTTSNSDDNTRGEESSIRLLPRFNHALSQYNNNNNMITGVRLARQSFKAIEKDELTIEIGDPIMVVHIYSDAWALGVNQHTGLSGVMPLCNLDPMNSSDTIVIGLLQDLAELPSSE